MRIKSNYQDLLKVFATITMFIDHAGLYFFPEYNVMRLVGRIAMPIFCFFAGYNFKQKPNIKILLFGVLLYLITTIILRRIMIANILISIYIGQWYLYLFRNQLTKVNNSYLHIIVLVLLGYITNYFFDYGSLVIAIMILGYIVIHNPDRLKIDVAVVIFLSIINTFILFNSMFNAIFNPVLNASKLYALIVIILGIFQYFLMVIKNFDQAISLNINIISRHTLLIYVIHLIIIQIIFIYC